MDAKVILGDYSEDTPANIAQRRLNAAAQSSGEVDGGEIEMEPNPRRVRARMTERVAADAAQDAPNRENMCDLDVLMEFDILPPVAHAGAAPTAAPLPDPAPTAPPRPAPTMAPHLRPAVAEGHIDLGRGRTMLVRVATTHNGALVNGPDVIIPTEAIRAAAETLERVEGLADARDEIVQLGDALSTQVDGLVDISNRLLHAIDRFR